MLLQRLRDRTEQDFGPLVASCPGADACRMRLPRRRQRKLGIDEAATWPRRIEDGNPRPRVLLEARDPAEALSYWRLLDQHGYDMSWCQGPDESSSCVLVTDGQCPLVDEADFVLTTLQPADVYAEPVLERLNSQEHMKPTIAVSNVSRWSALFRRLKVLNPFEVRRELPLALAAAKARSRRVQTAPALLGEFGAEPPTPSSAS